MLRVLAATALILVAPGLRAACGDAPAPGVDWSGCSKERLVLAKASLRHAKFERAILTGINFISADLRGANFASAELNRASFRSANLEGARFDKAVAVRSNFSSARFRSVMSSPYKLT